MNHIAICCTDGSDLSLEAIEAGLSLLDRAQWDVRVVTVVPRTPADPEVPGLMPSGTFAPANATVGRDLADSREEALDNGLATARAVAERFGVPADKAQVLVGEPGPTVVHHLEEVGASLVLVGTRRLSRGARFMEGSVSDHLIRHSPCPVIVGGEDVAETPEGPVVVCIDKSERSVDAGGKVVPLLAEGLPVALATVVPVGITGVEDEGDEELVIRRREQKASKILTAAADTLDLPDAELIDLVDDTAAHALVALAKSRPVRMLVVGSRGRGGLVRAVLGSTAEQLVREAPCLVCVMPSRH